MGAHRTGPGTLTPAILVPARLTWEHSKDRKEAPGDPSPQAPHRTNQGTPGSTAQRNMASKTPSVQVVVQPRGPQGPESQHLVVLEALSAPGDQRLSADHLEAGRLQETTAFTKPQMVLGL